MQGDTFSVKTSIGPAELIYHRLERKTSLLRPAMIPHFITGRRGAAQEVEEKRAYTFTFRHANEQDWKQKKEWRDNSVGGMDPSLYRGPLKRRETSTIPLATSQG